MRRFKSYYNEFVKPKFGYLSGYNPHPIVEENLADMKKELFIIKERFPQLANSNVDEEFLSKIREGQIVLPKEKEISPPKGVIGKPNIVKAERWILVPIHSRLSPSYNKAFELVLDSIRRDRNFFLNYREDGISEEYLIQLSKTTEGFKILEKMQKNHKGIIIVPVQLGALRCGQSDRCVYERMGPGEFGLGSFGNGIVLLTCRGDLSGHGGRLENCDDAWPTCIGDAYASDNKGNFTNSLYFRSRDGEVGLNARWNGHADNGYCVPTAFSNVVVK